MKSRCSDLERSWLFVPGDRHEKFSKALTSGSDAVILDLEDSVHPANREAARRSILALLEEVPDSPLWLRPSAAVPEIGSSEVQIVKHRAIRGLVLPKVESPDQVARMREITGAGKSFVVLVESARALLQSSAIARADGDLRLCFGSVDLLSDVQASSYELIKHCLMQLVLVARDAGIGPPIAGVTVNIHNVRELEAQTRDAISLGCFGKLCIHPSQVRVVNAFHRPSEQKITWAKSVIGLSDGKGVVVYEGKMIDAAVLREAKTILRLAERRN